MADLLHTASSIEPTGARRGASAGPGDVITPAPWVLTGRGLVVLLRARRRGPGRGLAGGISAVAFVDYESSDVGPYRELLHVPHVTRWSDAVGPTVDHIWVTLHASAISGNANWGLSKSVATIERVPDGRGSESWTAADDGGQLAAAVHRPFGPPLPVAKPAGLGRLLQIRDGQRFATPVGVRGLVRATHLTDLSLDAGRVTDLEDRRVLAAVAITGGTMSFGTPTVSSC